MNKEEKREYNKNYWLANKSRLVAVSAKWYEDKKDRLGGWRLPSYKNNKLIAKKKAMLASAKNRAKKKELEFNLTVEDIVIPEFCPILDVRLSLYEKKRTYLSPSLDRIDNTKGYIKGNIAVISWRANRIKSDADSKELRKVAD